MMFIGKAKMDARGRLTVPKSFIEANKVKTDTDVYFVAMTTSDNSVRLIFETEGGETSDDNADKN